MHSLYKQILLEISIGHICKLYSKAHAHHRDNNATLFMFEMFANEFKTRSTWCIWQCGVQHVVVTKSLYNCVRIYLKILNHRLCVYFGIYSLSAPMRYVHIAYVFGITHEKIDWVYLCRSMLCHCCSRALKQRN